MKIEILDLIEGAKKAKGLAVIIDVFRAFSVACYVINNNAQKVIPVGDIDIVYNLKKENPDFILMGERENKIQPGFDYGNSPTHVENIDFTGKTVVHTTSAGTQGIANAKKADEIITGSLVNAQAIIDYIKLKNPENVSLVCMGNSAIEPNEEDTFCAKYIKNMLDNGRYEFDMDELMDKLKKRTGKRFFDPSYEENCPMRDFYLCLDMNKFDFILKAEIYDKNLVYLKKIDSLLFP